MTVTVTVNQVKDDMFYDYITAGNSIFFKHIKKLEMILFLHINRVYIYFFHQNVGHFTGHATDVI